jgi:hypothetical protein
VAGGTRITEGITAEHSAGFMGILRPQIIRFAEQTHYNSLPRLKEIMENQLRELS